MSQSADRQLLFGLLALQTGLIRQDQLVAAFHAWTADKARPIDEHLVALGHLNEVQRVALDALVNVHAESHGGAVEKSLGWLAAGPSTVQGLAAVGDAELGASLGRVGLATTETAAEQTAAADSGESLSHGLRFRVLRPHAKGGLGAVYVALDSELNREVALKQILDRHADNPISRGRFLVEAEITGGLEHPGIVPVYGLGKYEDGRPFYAMRFIRGGTLGEAIEAFHKGPKSGPERSLEFRRLLKRFTDVCNTVEYAHSRGVLHRDLKPGNVIVGKHGETLVVDWGLAKALGRSASDADERALTPASASGSSETLPGQAMGTPAFMSPEQARGDLEALGPPSDVYSLGATLYQLLAGEPPFRGAVEDVLKAVEAGAFQRPREVDPSLDPALEAIALKAMAREPAQRYGSAKALAEDVDRWLADERVEAYPEPWTRSAGRWLSRRRTGVASVAAAGLVALIGLAAISIIQARANRALDLQRRRAEANETAAIDAVKRFTDAITRNPELKDNPELESLRKALLSEPLAFFGKLRERLQADADTRPQSLSRLAGAAHAHAQLLNEIGDKQDAISAHRQAVEIYDRLARDDPTIAKRRADLAASLCNLGVSLGDTGRADEARAEYERAIAIQERLVHDHPTVDEHQASLAASLNNLAKLARAAGRDDEARAAIERAIALLERLVRDRPAAAEHQADLATSLGNLGVLLTETGRGDEARAAFDRAIEILERLVRDHPAAAEHQVNLAAGLNNLGGLLGNLGRGDEARAAFERAIAILERLVRDHPAVIKHQDDLAMGLNNLGILLRAAGLADEARAARERAIAILERLVRDHPTVIEHRVGLAEALDSLGVLLGDAGRGDEARAAHERAIAILERLVRDHPAVTEHQVGLAESLNNLGVLFDDAGRADEARARYERAVAILDRLARDHPEKPDHASLLARGLENLAAIDLDASRFAEAREQLFKAIAWEKKALKANPENSPYRQFFEDHLKNLILAERGLDHEAEAARVESELAEFRRSDPRFADLEARLEAVGKGDAPKDAVERLTLAQRAYDTERFALAARLWGEALDADPKLADDRQEQRPYNAACAAALAAAGKGADAPDDAVENARLRSRALAWMKAELAVWAKLLETDQPQIKQAIAQTLRHWKDDADLAAIRGDEAIAQLPENERAGWKALWEGVDELLRKAE